MHEKRFSGDIARLRSPERVERLEVERAIRLCLEGGLLNRVLDVGTGSGLFAEGFSRHNLEVAGIDVNPEMLFAAIQFVPHGRFLLATAEELPFAGDSFDMVFYGLVLHESDEPLQVLQEAHRVCRQRVCLLEWPYREQPFGPPLADRLNLTRLETMFRQAGFVSWESLPLTNVSLHRLSG